MKKATESGDLITIGYHSKHLMPITGYNYSIKKLTPKAAAILDTLGERFYHNTRSRIYITSLTRTVESQQRLTKTNINATSKTSTHSYGASFDISYFNFNSRYGENIGLQKELEKILTQLQKEKRIYVIYERKMKCYHITAR